MKRIIVVLLAGLLLAGAWTDAQAAAEKDYTYKWGFSERVRHEYWKNNRDMDNNYYDGGDRNWFRIKTSLWGRVDYREDLGLYAKMSNENKAYMLLGAGGRKVYYSGHRYHDPDEFIFDNLYLDVKNPGDLPVTFRIGRQDLLNQYGENFLICDGTPGDGSRTFYFNAVKAVWKMDDENVLDVLYINNPRDDVFLPVLNEDKSPTVLNTTDEQGFVMYLKNTTHKNTFFEPFFMYKKEESDWGSGLQNRKSDIGTFGAFVKYLADPYTLRVQLCDQFGDYGPDEREAYAGYLFVDREFKDAAWKPKLTAGMAYLSGDEKSTATMEGFNPLFSRFPLYSELYGQAFASEAGVCYWTNLQMYRIGAAVTPSKAMKFDCSYSYLRANEAVNASATASLSGIGRERGHLFMGKLDYVFNKNFSAYLMGDYFIPSKKFYTDNADPAIFLRTQVEYKF